MPVFDSGLPEMIQIDGMFVDRDSLEIAERLQEYDPNLRILCVDPDHPDVDFASAPFIICEEMPDGRYVRIFEAWKLDGSILERVFMADKYKFDTLKRVDDINAAAKKREEARYKEVRDQTVDLVASIVGSTKSTYTFKNDQDELVKIHDDRPSEHNNAKKSFS